MFEMQSYIIPVSYTHLDVYKRQGYALHTRGNDYLSRIITSQNGKEYDYRNYDGMKKAYVIWILPQLSLIHI